MRRVKNIFVIMLMIGVLVGLIPPFTSYAADIVCEFTGLSSAEFNYIKNCTGNIITDLGDKIVSFESPSAKKEEAIIHFNTAEYDKLSQTDKQRFMELSLGYIQQSSVSTVNKTKYYNFIAGQDEATSNLVRQLSSDVNADFYSAYSGMNKIGFFHVVSVVMGIAVISIFTFLSLTIVLDLAYISIPMIRLFLESGQSLADEKFNTKSKSVKIKLVSYEAEQAVLEAEKVGTEYQPLQQYMRLKIKQFVILGVCLLYMSTGHLFDMVAMIMDMFSGILP